jgi:hypothetical protein
MKKANRTAAARAKRAATKQRTDARRPARSAPADADRPTAEELERAGQLRLIA